MQDDLHDGEPGGFVPPPPPNPVAPERGERGERDEGFAAPVREAIDAEVGVSFDPPTDPPAGSASVRAASALEADLLGLKRMLEGQLLRRVGDAMTVRRLDAARFSVQPTGMANLVGVGIGTAFADARGGTARRVDDGPGSPSLILYVVDPAPADQLRGAVATQYGVRALADDALPVTVVVTGIIDARPHRFPIRTAPAGCSVAHVNVTAGTLGALARGRTGERRQRLFILSNNHVLADSNAGRAGDAILQPSPMDGGVNPASCIANLERFITIDFAGGPNAVDAAVAWADPALVRRDFLHVKAGAPAFFRVGAPPASARLNMVVGKSGRTTQVTRGIVQSVTASITVNYGAGRMALFRDQIEIRDMDGIPFSQGGDSGSLIWTHDDARVPVGLLFAGGGQSTFANHIDHVLTALDVELVT